MKRCFLHIILLTLAFNTIYAQGDYRPFKIDLGLLMGELPEHNVGLFAPYVEPKVNLSNQLTLGLRFEFLLYSKQDFIVYNPDDPYFSDFDADGWTFSAVFTSDYYFNDHFLRPFVGCGVGVYQLYNAKENSYLDFNEELVALGFVPRAGFNIGQFRISCEYNSILSEKTETNLSYFSLKLGFELGRQKEMVLIDILLQ